MFARKQIPVSEDDVYELEIPEASNVVDNLDMKQRLERLPLPYREPLLLQVLGGFSCAEIADMLGTSEGAIMTRLTRARQTLRQESVESVKLKVMK